MDPELHLLASDVETTMPWKGTVLLSIYYSVKKYNQRSITSYIRLFIFDSNGICYTSDSVHINDADIPHVSFLKIHQLFEDGEGISMQINTRNGVVDITAEINERLTAEHIDDKIVEYKALMNENIDLLAELNEKYYPTMLNGLK